MDKLRAYLRDRITGVILPLVMGEAHNGDVYVNIGTYDTIWIRFEGGKIRLSLANQKRNTLFHVIEVFENPKHPTGMTVLNEDISSESDKT